MPFEKGHSKSKKKKSSFSNATSFDSQNQTPHHIRNNSRKLVASQPAKTQNQYRTLPARKSKKRKKVSRQRVNITSLKSKKFESNSSSDIEPSRVLRESNIHTQVKIKQTVDNENRANKTIQMKIYREKTQANHTQSDSTSTHDHTNEENTIQLDKNRIHMYSSTGCFITEAQLRKDMKKDNEDRSILRQLDDITKNKILHGYKQEVHPAGTICTCAVCGVCDDCPSGTLNSKNIFKLSELPVTLQIAHAKYNNMTQSERKRRHIVVMNPGGNQFDQYYHLAQEGLVTDISKKDEEPRWKFCSTVPKKRIPKHTNTNIRAFVCDTCVTEISEKKKTPPMRSFAFFDPGRVPKHLPRLNLSERLIMKKYVPFSSITKINRPTYVDGKLVPKSEHHKIYGHVIALPLSEQEMKENECVNLPRTDISKFIKITWTGTKQSWAEARRMNALTSILDVNLKNVLKWTKYFKMTEVTERINRDMKKIQRELKKQKKRILDGALAPGDAIIEHIEAQAGSDVAGMRPQMNDDHDEAVHKHNATPGIEHILLMAPQTNENVDELRNKKLQKMLDKTKAEKSKTEAAKPQPSHTLNLKLSDELPNEFTCNPQILKGAYPDLFLNDLTEKQLQGCAGLKSSIVERLLTFYDPRFAENKSFLFYMFSQKMRHAAAQQSALRFRGGYHAEKMTKLFQESDFDERLEYAIEHPKSKEAKELNKLLLPLVHVAGAKIPWGPLERRHALTHLYAMTQTFGLGGFFITFSPSMMDNPLTIRMIRRSDLRDSPEGPKTSHPLNESTFDGVTEKTHSFNWEDIPQMEDLAKRSKMIAQNPVESARMFDKIVRAFHKTILRLPLADETRENTTKDAEFGAFGHIMAGYGVKEVTGKGNLHYHGLNMCRITPELISQFAHIDDVRDAIIAAIDSVITGCINRDHIPKKSKDHVQPRWGMRNPPDNASQIPRDSDNINADKNHHRHTYTCAKCKKKYKGKRKCRLAMKRPHNCASCIVQLKLTGDQEAKPMKNGKDFIIEKPPDPDKNYPLPVPDNRVLAFELRRTKEDQLQTEASPITTSLLRCNTCTSFCGTREQAKNTVFYLPGYFSKLPTELEQSLPVFYAARQEAKKYPSQKENSGTAKVDAQYTVTKTLNRMTALMEYTDTQAASALLGHNSFCSSHKFWFLYAKDALAFQRQHPKNKDKLKILEESKSTPSDYERTSDDAKDNEMKQCDDPEDELIDLLHDEEQEHTPDTVHITTKRQFKSAQQHINYQYRGNTLKDLNLWEYTALISVHKKPEKPRVAKTRPFNDRYQFDPKHPLAETHEQVLRSKWLVPIITQKPPSPPKPNGRGRRWQQQAERWAQHFGTILFPWDIQSGCATVYSWKGICEAVQKWRDAPIEDIKSKHKLWLLNSLAMNLKIRPRSNRIVNIYRFREADILPDKFQNSAHDDKKDAKEREIAINAQHAINMIRLRNHAGHPSKTKQKSDAHLLDLENTFNSIYSTKGRKTKRKNICGYKRWNSKYTQYWADKQNKDLREKAVSDPEPTKKYNISDGVKSIEKEIQAIIKKHTLDKTQAKVTRNAMQSIFSDTQILLLLHGSPGTGKSHLIGALTEGLQNIDIKTKITATTGAAASLLPKATTINSLMGIYGMGEKLCYPFKINDKKANAIRSRMSGVKLLVCDEVSMLTPKILSLTNALLQAVYNNDLPFGGISVILVGDFYQKEPCAGKNQSLYQIAVNSTQGNELKNKTIENAASIFTKFRKVELEVQHRAGKDETKHLQLIQEMRTDEQPITLKRLQKIKQLSADDIKNVDWKFAPIVVTSNAERDRLNKLQAKRYAKLYDEPILVYYDPIRNSSGICDPESNDSKELSSAFPRLKRYFVRGAPCMLTQNLNPSIGLANGTNKDTKLHSLTWDPSTTHRNITLLRANKLKPGVEYEVPFPHSVNIISKDVEVPVLSYKARLSVPKYMRFNLGPGKRALLHQSHAVELGFSYTDYKIQGATVEKIILMLLKRPSVPHLTISSVYVGITRVKRGEDIRIWPMPMTYESTLHLTKLRRNIGLHLWMKNYINGVWNKSGLQGFNKRRLATAVKDVISMKAELNTKNVSQLRAIAKSLDMQHRTIPKAALLSEIRKVIVEKSKHVAPKSAKRRKNSRSLKKSKSSRKRKKVSTKKSCKKRKYKS